MLMEKIVSPFFGRWQLVGVMLYQGFPILK